MALSLKNITKIYNGQKALDNISFEINRGEIVGFLGPNGAGKTTTMKIISCFIPSTNGEARVCDIDVNKKPLEVKKKVGYLPENNPLYTEMYVKEFLLFIAAVHEIKNKKERVEQMIKLVGLEKEQHKKIEMLSKGYRQRIGLAQAMMHNPEVLILDEPTSGLDPNQLVEIRKLIKEFGKEKTVLLSTHIMQEVEAICDRVIIIKDGKIVADEGVDTIQKANQSVQVIQVEFDKEVLEKNLKAINEVSRIKNIGANSWLIESKSKSDLRASIAKFAAKKGLLTLTLKKEEDKLEDIFKKLTK
jgi:ABC-2 type transport system ATP-binding protein